MLFRRSTAVAPQPEPLAPIVLKIEGREVVVSLRRHPRARRYTLRVRAVERDVVLTLPSRGSVREAHAFAQRYTGWIAARLSRLPERVALEPGALLPLRGVPHRIVHRPDRRGMVWPEVAGGEPVLCVAGELPHVARRVTDFLKREARRDLTEASRRHAAALGVAIGRITLRDTASRWGSCSSNGGLSYSWRLILAPPFVLDYLAAHEVAHRREMNHGPAFWATVDRLFPEREQAERWLRSHGASLHRYGERAGG
ncbi:M48 family metallopeptidase [Ancylobacter lacus]|uniref:M48 family metallopeptidase n=1 Tax=Ancylobacter lacus TaxID=2579970 RepID=UPI001BD0947A|nr:SprT family zinc-dependent metalloprotease [Ancylobacter lacus]MBS7541035.1 M48 family metallopeptidase [Ancylobacter lacus]